VAGVVEGLLGGWSTLQGATSAVSYRRLTPVSGLSDIYIYNPDIYPTALHPAPGELLPCPARRCATIPVQRTDLSRFTGVLYIGFALGPEIAALILQNTHMTTLVFYTSAICASINILLLLFVFPEIGSIKKCAMRNVEAAQEARIKLQENVGAKWGPWHSIKSAVNAIRRALECSAKPRLHGRGRDWEPSHYIYRLIWVLPLTREFHLYGCRSVLSIPDSAQSFVPNQVSLC